MPFEMCPTAPAHVTELPLINRLQNADPTAMEELYTSYSRLAHRVIIDVVRDGGVAEDLVQETFLSVITSSLARKPLQLAILKIGRHAACCSGIDLF